MMDIFLVDDHPVLREGLVEYLHAEPDMQVVGQSDCAEDALEALDGLRVDVLVTDQSMPGMDGLELVTGIRRRYPEMGIVVLTMHKELYLCREMERAGADGYVLKTESRVDLARAVREVHAGRQFVSQAVTAALARLPDQEEDVPLLTARELEVLQLVVQELSNVEIADRLFISKFTVETHRKNIFRKTGMRSLVGLINFAHENGLVEN